MRGRSHKGRRGTDWEIGFGLGWRTPVFLAGRLLELGGVASTASAVASPRSMQQVYRAITGNTAVYIYTQGLNLEVLLNHTPPYIGDVLFTSVSFLIPCLFYVPCVLLHCVMSSCIIICRSREVTLHRLL